MCILIFQKGEAKLNKQLSDVYETSTSAQMSEGLRSSSTDPIYLNPSFGEVVMGFPEGWTDISAKSALRLWEMQSSRRSHSSLQGGSKR